MGSKITFFRPFVSMVIIAGLIFSISACNNLPNNGVPIYLHIDSPSVVSNSYFGSSSFVIPSVWATTGSHNLGAYEMPVDIPILAGGSVSVALSAGISDNGIISAPAMYPFYRPDTFTIPNAIPGHVYHHKPVYNYFSSTQVAFNETFDASNTFTNITPETNTVFEGFRSGGIVLSSSVDSLTATSRSYVINTNGRESYLELNYRLNNANVLCDIGVIATLYSGGQITQQNVYDKIVLTSPIGQWNKIYINFDNEIGANPNYNFQVYLTGYHTPGQNDTVFLDNIKLLYFQ